MKEFKTLTDVLFVPKGTKVMFDDGIGKDNVGKTGKILCTIPTGGGLFFDKENLELVA